MADIKLDEQTYEGVESVAVGSDGQVGEYSQLDGIAELTNKEMGVITVGVVGSKIQAKESSVNYYGAYNIAFGDHVSAGGRCSVATGSGTAASGDNSHAEGDSNTASGKGSHAEGYGTEASGYGAHAEGFLSDGDKTKASGGGSHAEGGSTEASGSYSHSEGRKTVASGYYSHAEGRETNATAWYAHAEGHGTTASGECSHAEGLNTEAKGARSHAGGYRAEAIGDNAFAHGKNTVALAYDSFAEGPGSVASGYASCAIGEESCAVGSESIALGYSNIATGSHETCFGRYNDHKHVEVSVAMSETGSGITNQIKLSVPELFDLIDPSETGGFVAYPIDTSVIGYKIGSLSVAEYSKSDKTVSIKYKCSSAGTYEIGLAGMEEFLETVGNGNNPSDHSNARTLDWSGNEELAGNLTAKGGTVTLGSTSLTEEQLTKLLALIK